MRLDRGSDGALVATARSMSRLTATLLVMLALGGCRDPIDPELPPRVPVVAETTGAESDDAQRDGESLLPPPPSATLRAPADDRRDEVDSETGAAPP